MTYRELEDLPRAVDFARQALIVRESVLGRLHPDTAASYSNMGALEFLEGNLDQALASENRALTISEELFGSRSYLRASFLRNIAHIYKAKGEMGRALSLQKEALTLRRDLFGELHPILREVAEMYVAAGRAQAAFHEIEQALANTPPNHPNYEILKKELLLLRERVPRPGFRQPRQRRRR